MHLRTLSPLCPRRPHHRTRTRNSTTPPGPESHHPNLTCRPRKPLCRRCRRRVSGAHCRELGAGAAPQALCAVLARRCRHHVCLTSRASCMPSRTRNCHLGGRRGSAREHTTGGARRSLCRAALSMREDRWQKNHKTIRCFFVNSLFWSGFGRGLEIPEAGTLSPSFRPSHQIAEILRMNCAKRGSLGKTLQFRVPRKTHSQKILCRQKSCPAVQLTARRIRLHAAQGASPRALARRIDGAWHEPQDRLCVNPRRFRNTAPGRVPPPAHGQPSGAPRPTEPRLVEPAGAGQSPSGQDPGSAGASLADMADTQDGAAAPAAAEPAAAGAAQTAAGAAAPGQGSAAAGPGEAHAAQGASAGPLVKKKSLRPALRPMVPSRSPLPAICHRFFPRRNLYRTDYAGTVR